MLGEMRYSAGAGLVYRAPRTFPHEMLIDLAAVWSRNMSEARKFGLMEETNITDFEVEIPDS